MRLDDYGLTASGSIPVSYQVEEAIKHMEETTENTIELSLIYKGQNLFWILYLTDKLSDNWGVCVMLYKWTLIDFSRRTKWWRRSHE